MRKFATNLFLMSLLLQACYASDGGIFHPKDFHKFGVVAKFEARDRGDNIRDLYLSLPANTKDGGLAYVAITYSENGKVILSTDLYRNDDFVKNPTAKSFSIGIRNDKTENMSFHILYGNQLYILRGFNEL